MGVRDEALRALENRDWSGAAVDDSPPPSTVVQSTRLPVDLFERLVATAEERGVKPGVLVRQFVEQGLSPAGVSGIATVHLDRLRAELDQAVQRARVIPPAA
jgi:hypothetical protein